MSVKPSQGTISTDLWGTILLDFAGVHTTQACAGLSKGIANIAELRTAKLVEKYLKDVSEFQQKEGKAKDFDQKKITFISKLLNDDKFQELKESEIQRILKTMRVSSLEFFTALHVAKGLSPHEFSFSLSILESRIDFLKHPEKFTEQFEKWIETYPLNKTLSFLQQAHAHRNEQVMTKNQVLFRKLCWKSLFKRNPCMLLKRENVISNSEKDAYIISQQEAKIIASAAKEVPNFRRLDIKNYIIDSESVKTLREMIPRVEVREVNSSRYIIITWIVLAILFAPITYLVVLFLVTHTLVRLICPCTRAIEIYLVNYISYKRHEGLYKRDDTPIEKEFYRSLFIQISHELYDGSKFERIVDHFGHTPEYALFNT